MNITVETFAQIVTLGIIGVNVILLITLIILFWNDDKKRFNGQKNKKYR